jgi:hypothetical protein
LKFVSEGICLVPNRDFQFVLQSLEQRLLFSVTPSGAPVPPAPVPAQSGAVLLSLDPGAVLTNGMRADLLAHWSGPNKADLQSLLDQRKWGAFDGALLSYMQSRSDQSFFWKTGDVAGIKSFVNTNLTTGSVVPNADHVLSHQFPDGSSTTYNVDLGSGEINWLSAPSGVSGEFIHNLNRMDFWQDLAQAYVFTGNGAYIDELVAQLSSWSSQSPGLSDPNQWASSDPPWEPLDVAQRADNWTWAYQMILNSSAWTGTANTLFLYKLYQHGDFLRRVTPYAASSNRSTFEATGLLEIASLVPEFDQAADWNSYGHTLLFQSMDGQFNADGGQDESSPGYAGAVIQQLLEMYWLDQKQGDTSAWDGARLDRLKSAANSYVQLLSPDGNLAALSDTYRQSVATFWDHPRIILSDTTDFPAAKPRLRDVWLFGTSTSGSMLGASITPSLPARGNTFAMPDSGYYVMRSGSDSNARQVTFDAGPTGGQHGHLDLLNFELFGYGHPLISDPGLYTYDSSARRNWAISTPAHNTISVDGLSHAALEGVGNPGITSTGIENVAGGYQITASHRGYQGLVGAPVVTRSLWYDGDGTMLVVDWGESTSPHTYSQSFLLPGTDTSRDLAAGWIHSNNASGGNVEIQTLLQSGQAAYKDSNIPGASTPVFTSDDPDANIANPATRFHIDQTGTFAGFISLVTTYSGTTAPNITAELVNPPTPGGAFQVQIYRNGVAAELIMFTEPDFDRPGSDFRPAAPIAGANDVAYDSAGRLHMVYNDRNEKDLKYSVRDTNGQWSIVQTIDASYEAGGYPSLALDSHGNPAVAYFDGNGGDLKYAKMVDGAWQVETVDSKGSVGLYPSLVMSRNDGAMIGYYRRTSGDLRLAVQVTGGWQITNIDTAGDVGRCTSMSLDPNRPTASKIAIAYDDSNTGEKKFAIQQGAGWAISTVDSSTPTGGGYTSLAYEPFKESDGVYHPTMSYYDSSNSALKFAFGSGSDWYSTTVVSQGAQGLYTSLFYDSGNKANIFFFKKTNTTAYRARGSFSKWSLTYLGTGGREVQTALKPDGTIAWTDLDSDGLRVELI